MPVLAIGYETDSLVKQASQLATELNLVVSNHILPRLSVTPEKLVLLMDHFSPLFVDFNDISWKRRREEGKKQGLIRACKPHKGLRILDATPGWGRDAALLAGFGADVMMVERDPIMAALLGDGLRRLPSDSLLAITLLKRDSKYYLQTLSCAHFPDVIYIDPMHPLRQKAALVKKDMQALQQLLGPDNDVHELLEIALTRAQQRVVVKWPQRLSPLCVPTYSVEGKTVRFDVYVTPTLGLDVPKSDIPACAGREKS